MNFVSWNTLGDWQVTRRNISSELSYVVGRQARLSKPYQFAPVSNVCVICNVVRCDSKRCATALVFFRLAQRMVIAQLPFWLVQAGPTFGNLPSKPWLHTPKRQVQSQSSSRLIVNYKSLPTYLETQGIPWPTCRPVTFGGPKKSVNTCFGTNTCKKALFL